MERNSLRPTRYRTLSAGDILLIGILALGAVFGIMRRARTPRGEYAEIIAPDSTMRITLNKDNIIRVSGKIGTVEISVSNAALSITDVDCPLRLCQKQGSISGGGSALVCVPNQVMVRISGGDADIDGVTY